MNPILRHEKQTNSSLLPQSLLLPRAMQLSPRSQHTIHRSDYRKLFPNRASYGPLIAPKGETLRTSMPASSSCNDIPKQERTRIDSESQNSKPRSNLSALLNRKGNLQEKEEKEGEALNPGICSKKNASNTSPSRNPRQKVPSDSDTETVETVVKTKTRRCFSSKELGSLAPPSGSPYSFMLSQKEQIEVKMTERLKQTRENEFSECTNEARNRRRAEHTRAVTNELCEIVSDLFVSESKLINPSQYGVDSALKRETVLRCVESFVGSLPPRYALMADTPSEVLLHMRLVAAVRSDPTKAVVHITSLENNTLWTQPLQNESSRKLVTIACTDATGLLEYVSKLLGTGGSRVLDADVMLNSDNVALDRFVVEMNGRLRLDKLSQCIESFLAQSSQKQKNASSISRSSSMESNGSNSSKQRDISSTVYYSPKPSETTVIDEESHVKEMKTAIPLSKVLASGSPGTRTSEIPLPSIKLERKKASPSEVDLICSNKAIDSAVHDKTFSPPESLCMTQRRPLVNRDGRADFDREEEYSDSSRDYMTYNIAPGAYKTIPLIPFDELMLIETLGSGRVSTIYRAAWRKLSPSSQHVDPSTSHMLALKVAMVPTGGLDTSHVDELRREADIAARLKHPNICDLKGVAADSECFCLAYEFCEGGSLMSLLSDSNRYYEYLPIALDVAKGMAYLHSRNVIHRDLKPSNILLTRDHRAKIADFGMSVANTGQELTAETGTYRYMAPEVIRHESYSSNADVYSFGVCLWQLVTREVPFASMTPIQAAYSVAEGRRPVIPESTPNRLKEIITACWDQDAGRRPSFTYIAMALADYAKMAFSPANVGAQTLQIANEMLANVDGNSTINVDFTISPHVMGTYLNDDADLSLRSSRNDDIGLEI